MKIKLVFPPMYVVCCLINDNPDGLLSVHITRVCQPVASFGIKFANSSDAMPA